MPDIPDAPWIRRMMSCGVPEGYNPDYDADEQAGMDYDECEDWDEDNQ